MGHGGLSPGQVERDVMRISCVICSAAYECSLFLLFGTMFGLAWSCMAHSVGSGHGGRHQGSGLLHSGCSIGQTTSVGRAMVWASYYCEQSGGMGELLLWLVWWYGRATGERMQILYTASVDALPGSEAQPLSRPTYSHICWTTCK